MDRARQKGALTAPRAHLSSPGTHPASTDHPRAVTLPRAGAEPPGPPSSSPEPHLHPSGSVLSPQAFVYHRLWQAGDFKFSFLKEEYYIKKCFKCLRVFCSSLLHKSDINSQGRALLSAITEDVSGMKAVLSLLMFPNYRPFGSKRKR